MTNAASSQKLPSSVHIALLYCRLKPESPTRYRNHSPILSYQFSRKLTPISSHLHHLESLPIGPRAHLLRQAPVHRIPTGHIPVFFVPSRGPLRLSARQFPSHMWFVWHPIKY